MQGAYAYVSESQLFGVKLQTTCYCKKVQLLAWSHIWYMYISLNARFHPLLLVLVKVTWKQQGQMTKVLYSPTACW